jgi:hypothetical protein
MFIDGVLREMHNGRAQCGEYARTWVSTGQSFAGYDGSGIAMARVVVIASAAGAAAVKHTEGLLVHEPCKPSRRRNALGLEKIHVLMPI